MYHIIERFFIHFASSAFIVLAIFFSLRTALRRSTWFEPWVSSRKSHLLVTSALIVAAILTLREPWDIYAGNNTFIKSIFDQLSWWAGSFVAAWGLYRFGKE